MLSLKKAIVGSKNNSKVDSEESVSGHTMSSTGSSDSKQSRKNRKTNMMADISELGHESTIGSRKKTHKHGASKEEIDFFLNMDKKQLLERLGQVAIEDEVTTKKSSKKKSRKSIRSRETPASALLRHLEEGL
ncbi:expressed unknown protein [Seminavis robusta]|uniref:Uncharacterized protein n=1 Tax=Seminavis robusta TaxID=568900 RepID=A0A9N8DY82_9STRA|nr:expressed unknown protein [Seminavis robusta]|eukprot:Sro468_g149220.1 n/a (133) ;mRNA; f:50755-51153